MLKMSFEFQKKPSEESPFSVKSITVYFTNLLVTSGIVARSDAIGGQTGVEVRTADAILDSCLGLRIPADVIWIDASVHTCRIWIRYALKKFQNFPSNLGYTIEPSNLLSFVK